jgi:hypothetical protein
LQRCGKDCMMRTTRKKKKWIAIFCVTSGVPLRSSMSSIDSQARSTFWWSGAGGAFLDLELL